MSTIIRKVLRADGTVEQLDRAQTIAQVRKLIGADVLDRFILADGVHVCMVDDTGLLTGLPINEAATRLYQQRTGGNGHICGDAVVLPDSDFGGPL